MSNEPTFSERIDRVDSVCHDLAELKERLHGLTVARDNLVEFIARVDKHRAILADEVARMQDARKRFTERPRASAKARRSKTSRA